MAISLNTRKLSPILAVIMSYQKSSLRTSSDVSKFRELVKSSKRIVALTGAGISAESGIPTFRGAGGLWRKFVAQELATPSAFRSNPSRVWQFYSYRREVVLTKQPNRAHDLLAETEERMAKEGKKLTVITQNIDELHRRAGSKNIIELHGSLFQVRCTKCNEVTANHDSPICQSLRDTSDPDIDLSKEVKIPIDQLPKCNKCDGLLRPAVVWFNESLDPEVLDAAQAELECCDLCLVIGTSSVVYPAAMFAPAVAARGVPVAEFNIETTASTKEFGFHFSGPCSQTLPEVLKP